MLPEAEDEQEALAAIYGEKYMYALLHALFFFSYQVLFFIVGESLAAMALLRRSSSMSDPSMTAFCSTLRYRPTTRRPRVRFGASKTRFSCWTRALWTRSRRHSMPRAPPMRDPSSCLR